MAGHMAGHTWLHGWTHGWTHGSSSRPYHNLKNTGSTAGSVNADTSARVLFPPYIINNGHMKEHMYLKTTKSVLIIIELNLLQL